MKLKSVVSNSTLGRRGRLLVRLGTAVFMVVALVALIASLALALPTGFPDVPAGHHYHSAIMDLASRGIIGGYANGNFGPNDDVMRQQFAKMIVGAAGYPVSEADTCSFVDVEKSDATGFYPDNFVAVCAAHGITVGKTATTFDPYGKITRYQVISMVVRAADDLQAGLLAAPPTGWTAASGWADDPTHGANAARAQCNGLLNGLDLSVLSPYGNMSRGEVAQVLHNLLVLLGSSGGSTTTSSSTTTTLVPVTPAGHDLMYFWWSAADGWKSHNVSQTVGSQLASPVDYWPARNDLEIEHLAGRAPNGDLLVFWDREHLNNWQVVNVSTKTGQKIAGAPTFWNQGYGWEFRDNLAALDDDGDVINFWWQSPDDWMAMNVTQTSTGPKLRGELTCWSELDSTNGEWVDRVAGQSTANDLIVFWTGARQGTWQAVNVSAITGQKIGGPVAYWSTDYDPGSVVQHLAGRSPSGDLLVFWWSEAHDWQVINVTQAIGGQKISGSLVGYVLNQAEHIAARAESGDLLHFWYKYDVPVREWHVENLTTLTAGPQIAGDVSCYLTWDVPSQTHIFAHLIATTPDHRLAMFFGQSFAHTWNALSPPVGWPDVLLRDGLTGWETYHYSTAYDHIAGLEYEHN